MGTATVSAPPSGAAQQFVLTVALAGVPPASLLRVTKRRAILSNANLFIHPVHLVNPVKTQFFQPHRWLTGNAPLLTCSDAAIATKIPGEMPETIASPVRPLPLLIRVNALQGW